MRINKSKCKKGCIDFCKIYINYAELLLRVYRLLKTRYTAYFTACK